MKLYKFTTLIETDDKIKADDILESLNGCNHGDGIYMHVGGEELHPKLKKWPISPALKLIKQLED